MFAASLAPHICIGAQIWRWFMVVCVVLCDVLWFSVNQMGFFLTWYTDSHKISLRRIVWSQYRLKLEKKGMFYLQECHVSCMRLCAILTFFAIHVRSLISPVKWIIGLHFLHYFQSPLPMPWMMTALCSLYPYPKLWSDWKYKVHLLKTNVYLNEGFGV